MAKIKVAVIGAGMMGKNHLKTYKSLPNVELVGVYDIFPEAAQCAPLPYCYCCEDTFLSTRLQIIPPRRQLYPDVRTDTTE